jgi:hypothetical protein
MSISTSMHSLQIKADDPLINFLTSYWLFPQNAQRIKVASHNRTF